VIGIAGTTEEGAVDPIDRIDEVRTDLENARGESFWLHVDAAWGGYLRALFTAPAGEPATTLQGIREFVSRELELERGAHKKQLTLSWGDRDVYAAFRVVSAGGIDHDRSTQAGLHSVSLRNRGVSQRPGAPVSD
jgi:hypothetical protein